MLKIYFRSILILSIFLLPACHSNDSAKQAQLEAAPLPINADWSKVKPAAPAVTPDLALWLRADAGVQRGKKNEVTSWKDESSAGLELQSLGQEGGPVFVQKGIGLKPMIRFSGPESMLRSIPISGSKFLSTNDVSVFVVLRPDAKHSSNDTLGWGDCGSNRFNLQLGFYGSLYFQMGNPNLGQASVIEPKNWEGQAHIVSVVRQGTQARFSVDGAALSAQNLFSQKLDLDVTAPVILGGLCQNGFWGGISEVLILKTGLARADEEALTKYLAEKYKINLL